MAHPSLPRPVLLAAAVGALAFLGAPALRAGDEPTPAARYAACAAALPAPSDDGGFVLEGDATVEGHKVGTFRFSARPAPADAPDAPAQWAVEEEIALGAGDDAVGRKATARLTAQLAPVSGTTHRDDEQGEATFAWQRDGDHYAVVVTGEGMEGRSRQADAETPATTTITAFLLLGRLGAPRDGEAEVQVLTPEWNPLLGEKPWAPARIQPLAKGTWAGHPALLLTARKEERDLTAAYDPATHALLGLELGSPGHPDVVYAPPPPKDEEPPSPFDVPAKTPEAAAARAALALATGDVDMFDRSVHWPTVYAAYAKKAGDDADDADTWHAAQIALYREHMPSNPRAMVETVLPGVMEQVTKTRQEDGTVVIVFPPLFHELRLVVGEADGLWYLVELPRD
jgi:hypothetical protein